MITMQQVHEIAEAFDGNEKPEFLCLARAGMCMASVCGKVPTHWSVGSGALAMMARDANGLGLGKVDGLYGIPIADKRLDDPWAVELWADDDKMIGFNVGIA